MPILVPGAYVYSPTGQMNIEDKRLIQAFRNDDELGLKELFKRYYRPLCVYAFKFLDDIHLAEDIVQDLFIGFWEEKKYKNVKGSIKNYLFVSVRNRSINYLTSHKVVNTDYIKNLEKEFTFQYYDEDEISDRKEKLHLEIAKLPPQSQKVLKKIVFEKKKYKEVSEELNVSLNTVKTHFSRALKHLRGSMDLIILLMLP